MDSDAALILLELIESHKEVLLSKSQKKPDIAKKLATWSQITDDFQKATTLPISTVKLRIKWKNALSSLKDKLKHSKNHR